VIKTWNERCQTHPDHQTGMVSHRMIQARMQEEIDELRAALAQPEPAAPYPLPDALYESKDWAASDYAGRVELLHFMYESKRREVEQLETAQPEQEPCHRESTRNRRLK
jgi:hypothetical protein